MYRRVVKRNTVVCVIFFLSTCSCMISTAAVAAAENVVTVEADGKFEMSSNDISGHSKATQTTMADILYREIVETKEAIELQERKIEMLERLRETLEISSDVPIFESVDVLEEWLSRTKKEEKGNVSTTASSSSSSLRQKFYDHVVPRTTISSVHLVSSAEYFSLEMKRNMFDRTAKKKLPFPSGMVGIGDTAGGLRLYHINGSAIPSTTESLRDDEASLHHHPGPVLQTGHKSPIVRMGYDFSRRGDARIVTAAEDGSIHLHRISAWCHGRLVLGFPRRITRQGEIVESRVDPRYKAAGTEYEKAPTNVGMVVRLELEEILVDPS